MREVAVVGSGLAALTAFAALHDAEVEADVLGLGPDPAGAWRERASAIRQTHMRSESDGHCRPHTFPGLAVREAWRRRDPRPLALSLLDRYRPSVGEFLADVERVRRETGWDAAFRERNVRTVTPVCGGFTLDGEGPYRHVLLAPGHPGLAYALDPSLDPRVVHAYTPHEYAERVAVIGAGMAAATEWRNALAAGAEVVSVRRREPLRRPLNLPRHLFTKRGLARYHASPVEERAAFLRGLSTPSYPPGPEWDVPVRVEPRVPEEVDQVICATGFRQGWQHQPLLAPLADAHALPRANGWLLLDDDATVPGLTDGSRTLALSGVPAQWAYPAADTLMGMRYVAHAFVRRCRTR